MARSMAPANLARWAAESNRASSWESDEYPNSISTEAMSCKGHGFEFAHTKLSAEHAEQKIRFSGDIGYGVMTEARFNRIQRQKEKARRHAADSK